MKKILVIEDNLEVRENICELLELSGYIIFSAENGKEGVKKAILELPDLIICDVMMPVLDGYGTLKVLHRNPKTTHIPFIFLTAKADKGDFRKGMSMGADDYIVKPFTDLELIESIETRLEKVEHLIPSQSGGNVFDVTSHYQESLTAFIANKEIRFYNKKDYLFKENTLPHTIFLLKTGKAQSSKINTWGKELVLSFYAANDFVGLKDAFHDNPYQKSATCLEDSEVILIPKDELIDWIRADLSIAQYFLKLLANQASQKDKELLNMAYSSVRERVASALLKLRSHYHDNSNQNFEVNILREDLAHIVGTAKETVIRMLSEFKTEKLIDIHGSKLTLLDIKGLENIGR